MNVPVTRRRVLMGAAGLVGAVALAGCSDSVAGSTAADVRRAEQARRRSGARTVRARLEPRPVTLDLGGRTVATWGYAESAPGPLLRARAGDVLRVEVVNRLPADTSVHWHGVALRNDMDGVPGQTQDPIRPGTTFTYEFTVPDAGTYWYHPHVGAQLDRALYGVLLVDDPADPGRYDVDWTVVLDDWVDGTGRTPDDVLAELTAGGGMGGMGGGMGHGMGDMGSGGMGGMGESMVSPLLGGAGDVAYPFYLANGRLPSAPETLRARPGQRLRLRLVNAGSDTAFRVALGGHRFTVTHTDGFPVRAATADSLLVGMGERYDVEVTLGEGVFPLVAVAEGKRGRARALIRTGAGAPPAEGAVPGELGRPPLTVAALRPRPDVALADRSADRTHALALGGGMMPYRWTINGRTFPDSDALPLRAGERVRLRLVNRTMMFHPMHLHGHTFAVADTGVRKDTVIVRPHEVLDVDLDADNPGRWMAHCHNIYHAEAGMMVELAYRT
jgi:multicopper oxidase